ncbi:MAG: pyridoxal-phosphate dependent enzyme [Ginsengibacter sp.]
MNTLEILLKKPVQIDHLQIKSAVEQNIIIDMLRLDKVHPFISGNKLFKLYYFIIDAMGSPGKKIITFGGAYSNHLAATAAACKENNIECIGIVNGTKPKILSDILMFCQNLGMHLEFASRDSYQKQMADILSNKHSHDPGHTIIPEGGFSDQGVEGAALIACHYEQYNYSHICCATGSGTTLAGLAKKSPGQQKVLGFSAVKNLDDLDAKMKCLVYPPGPGSYEIIAGYHFGGFAKKTRALIEFMNGFYNDQRIPLDFVYTAKMMYGILDMLQKNYFPGHSRILCIHTGGLLGNLSLNPGTLDF